MARAGRGGRWTNLENSEISKQTGIQTLSKSICGPRWRSPHISGGTFVVCCSLAATSLLQDVNTQLAVGTVKG